MGETSTKQVSNSRTSVISNTIWILGINFRKIPLVTCFRIIGFINTYGSRLLSSFILALIIDWIIKYTSSSNKDNNLLVYSLLVFGGYYIVTNLASILSNYGGNLSSIQLSNFIPQTMLHEKLNKLSTSTLENPEVQNIITRYRENINMISESSRGILNIMGITVTLIIATLPLLSLLPITTLLLILVSIPNIFSNKRIFGKLWSLDKETTVQYRRGYSVLHMISEPEFLKEIRLIEGYKFLRSYFDNYINKYFGKLKSIYKEWSLFDVLNAMLKGGIIIFAIYQIIGLASVGIINIGQIIFYISALTIISDDIDSYSAYISSYLGGNLRLSEMRELLEYKEEYSLKKDIEILKTPPHILLKNISFKYQGSNKEVINNLNLEIKPGEKIAIVGENGAGKTTLIKLISNIYPVTEGEILINGQDLNSISPDSWFQNLGVLYQDFNTYSDLSVKENIALGRISEPLDQKLIELAAQNADAHDFIMKFDNKYDQILSEKYTDGIRPSTGQWQKIAIARFFYRNAPILILDEPTASIDAVAEANIFDRIYSFIKDKTVIIVSHRFSTVRNADRIIVLDNGRIVEEGSHKELLKNNGMYSNAFRLQAKGYED